MYEKTIFNIKLERMLEKYSKEDQENIRKEIEEVLEMSGDTVLDFNIVALIIKYYFKFEKFIHPEIKNDLQLKD